MEWKPWISLQSSLSENWTLDGIRGRCYELPNVFFLSPNSWVAADTCKFSCLLSMVIISLPWTDLTEWLIEMPKFLDLWCTVRCGGCRESGGPPFATDRRSTPDKILPTSGRPHFTLLSPSSPPSSLPPPYILPPFIPPYPSLPLAPNPSHPTPTSGHSCPVVFQDGTKNISA